MENDGLIWFAGIAVAAKNEAAASAAARFKKAFGAKVRQQPVF